MSEAPTNAQKPLPTIEEVQAKYIADRDRISALNKEIDAIKVFQKRREEWLGARMTQQGVKTAATDSGSCFFKKTETVRVDDMDAFLDYVKKHQAWELLPKSVVKSEALHIMGEKRDQPLPAGLSYTSINAVQVRRK